MRGALGIAFLLSVCFLLSNNRKKINWMLVGRALLLQIVLAIAVLRIDVISNAFGFISGFFLKVIEYTEAGTQAILGGALIGKGGNVAVTNADDVVGSFPAAASIGYVFAFRALPAIIFFSALSSLLYYFGILQRVVYYLALGLQKIIPISAPESMGAAANIFMGQTEAPLAIKPYLEKMTKSQLLALMVGGMATIAGGVMVAYVGFLGGDDTAQQAIYAKHLLAASVMAAPGAYLIAKILLPETEDVAQQDLTISNEQMGNDVLDAINRGSQDGLRLAVNVAVMLLVFTALITMVNSIFSSTIGAIPIGGGQNLNDFAIANSTRIGANGETITLFQSFNLEYLLGWILAPVAWLLGTPTDDILIVGQLLGKKTILNEFIAYADVPTVSPLISEKAKIILTYGLCGFANFASIGIQVAGVGALAPAQKPVLSEIGVKALIGGTIASFMSASIVGMFYA